MSRSLPIDELLAKFDFEKAAKVMSVLDWTWIGEGVPSAKRLEETARELCEDMINEGCTGSRTGGLRVEERAGLLELTLVPVVSRARIPKERWEKT